MALEGMTRLIQSIGASLQSRLKAAKEKGMENIAPETQKRFMKRFEEAEVLAVTFQLAEDVDMALDAVRKTVMNHVEAEIAAKFVKNRERQMARQPVAVPA